MNNKNWGVSQRTQSTPSPNTPTQVIELHTFILDMFLNASTLVGI